MCYNVAMSNGPQKGRRTLNISLTPHLHGFVMERVESGLYTSASEVVREGLRSLAGSAEDPRLENPTLENRTLENRTLEHPTLDDAARWRDLRARLLEGEHALRAERIESLGSLFLAGVEFELARLRQADPGASEATLSKRLAVWLRGRCAGEAGSTPGSSLRASDPEMHDGGLGRPVSEDRLRKLRGGG